MLFRSGSASAVCPGVHEANGGKLFFIQDKTSNNKFLVDTGSTYCILPYRSNRATCGPSLAAANGVRIRCWGYRRSAITIGGQEYRWNFLLAEVRFPILGIDFLKKNELLVDVNAGKLIPRAALAVPAAADVASVTARVVPPAAAPSSWSSLLLEFPGVTQPFAEIGRAHV